MEQTKDTIRMQLWLDEFRAWRNKGNATDKAAKYADECLKEFDDRFNHGTMTVNVHGDDGVATAGEHGSLDELDDGVMYDTELTALYKEPNCCPYCGAYPCIELPNGPYHIAHESWCFMRKLRHHALFAASDVDAWNMRVKC
ncbi:MAG: hypothetical protein KJ630_19030 [Proteobacteria bacterium]|nr:hypothetical protein [Pseudomonadota bacterium]